MMQKSIIIEQKRKSTKTCFRHLACSGTAIILNNLTTKTLSHCYTSSDMQYLYKKSVIHPHQRCGYSDSPFARRDTFLYCRVWKWVGGVDTVAFQRLDNPFEKKKHIFHPSSQAPGPGPGPCAEGWKILKRSGQIFEEEPQNIKKEFATFQNLQKRRKVT